MDPNDPTAFVTDLTFTGPGVVNMSQIPVTQDTGGGSSIPEPATLVLMGIGLVDLVTARRRH